MLVNAVGDKVIVKAEALDEEVQKGIIVAVDPKDVSPQGIALSVGPDNPQVDAGDLVIYSKYGFQAFKINDEFFHSVPLSEILAIIKPE